MARSQSDQKSKNGSLTRQVRAAGGAPVRLTLTLVAQHRTDAINTKERGHKHKPGTLAGSLFVHALLDLAPTGAALAYASYLFLFLHAA